MTYPIQKYGSMPAYGPASLLNFTKTWPKRFSISFDSIQYDPTADYKVVVQCEPPALYRSFVDMIQSSYQNFDLVLTYNPDLLTLPNAEEFLCISAWVDELELEKRDQITYLMSSKILTAEHRMRFQILRRVERSNKIGKFEFLMHRNPPEIPNKNIIFRNAKFNIACENHIFPNMFTEKLIDCFRTKTVPIYYGCPNIDKFFNPRGIIPFWNINQFQDIVNNIDPSWYDAMMPYVEENYELAKPYFQQNIYQRLEDLLEKKLQQQNLI